MKKLANLVYDRRCREGITVREAGAQIGCSAATVSRTENGFTPDLVTFARMAVWLRVDANKLLEEWL